MAENFTVDQIYAVIHSGYLKNEKLSKNFTQGGHAMRDGLINLQFLMRVVNEANAERAKILKSGSTGGASRTNNNKRATKHPMEESSSRDASCSNKKQRTDAPPN